MQAIAQSAPFIDFYALLGLPADAEPATIRQAINKLYLHAQDNISHRNFRKRFYFHELVEIQLPQARHILLDDLRRAEYDERLLEHRDGNVTVVLSGAAEFSADESGAATTSTGATRIAATGIAPTVTSTNGTGTNGTVATDAIATNRLVATTVEKEAQTAAAAKTIAFEVTQQAEPQHVAPLPHAARPEAPAWARMDAERVEIRRDHKRRELIRNELIGTGIKWGISGGLVTVGAMALGLVLVFYTTDGNLPLGLSPQVFDFSCFALMVALATLSARESLRFGRRQVVTVLSKMPYEELLHRCSRG